MSDLTQRIANLQKTLEDSLGKLNFTSLLEQRKLLEQQVEQTGFWDTPIKAQKVSKQLAVLSRRLQPWENLVSNVNDLAELALTNDKNLEEDLDKQLTKSEKQYEQLKSDLRFSGPYDSRGVIISLFAGAGGTDAQDWTQMLLRMYIRWAEKEKLPVKIVDESPGEETGLKGITFEIDSDFIFGKLKGEHGVHRLVRLSPFNSDNLRQTSFARVEVLPMIDQPDDLNIDDKDIRIDVYRSSGHGGQSVNTTDSAVRVTHIPTGIAVAIQNERSQLQNKETALTILRSKLIQLQLEQHQEKIESIKGPNQSAEWGNQIRSYVLHPYKQVKDLRTKYETSDVDSVLDGDIDSFINAYLDYSIGQ